MENGSKKAPPAGGAFLWASALGAAVCFREGGQLAGGIVDGLAQLLGPGAVKLCNGLGGGQGVFAVLGAEGLDAGSRPCSQAPAPPAGWRTPQERGPLPPGRRRSGSGSPSGPPRCCRPAGSRRWRRRKRGPLPAGRQWGCPQRRLQSPPRPGSSPALAKAWAPGWVWKVPEWEFLWLRRRRGFAFHRTFGNGGSLRRVLLGTGAGGQQQPSAQGQAGKADKGFHRGLSFLPQGFPAAAGVTEGPCAPERRSSAPRPGFCCRGFRYLTPFPRLCQGAPAGFGGTRPGPGPAGRSPGPPGRPTGG